MKASQLIFALLLCVFSFIADKTPAFACGGSRNDVATSGKITWTDDGSGGWIAKASDGRATGELKLAGDQWTPYDQTFGYAGKTVLVKPNATDCHTWYFKATFSGYYGCPWIYQKTDTISGTHTYTNGCPALTPTSTPTATPTPTPTPTPAPLTLKVSSSSNNICAGGWDQSYNNGAGGYYYLSKETGNWVPHSVLPDPHIAVLTAQVGGETGGYKGLSIQFKWTMPGGSNGSGLVESRSVAVDSKGKATVQVVSGDEIGNGVSISSELVDAQGKLQAKAKSVNLNIKEPDIERKYKNEKGDYVSLPQDNDLLFLDPNSATVPLQAILTFNKVPVFGHHVSWGIDKVFAKSGAPVSSGASDYGNMSGATSTTDQKGAATATFTKGGRIGQLIYYIEDGSVYIMEAASSQNGPQAVASHNQNSRSIEAEIPLSRRKKESIYKTPPYAEYAYVKEQAGYQNPHGYPAPPGEEDDELLPQTLNTVEELLVPIAPKIGGYIKGEYPESPEIWQRRDQGGIPFNAWWFSQCVGNDPESYGRHLADVKVTARDDQNKTITNPKTGEILYSRYSGAFDIVLSEVPIFEAGGRRIMFGPFVKKLRDNGFVAWHRWAGETHKDTSENEMHCIDPATPYLKPSLGSGPRGQIASFLQSDGRGTGGGYPSEPTNPKSRFYYYFHISRTPQQDNVRLRLNNPYVVKDAHPDHTAP